MKKTFTAFLTLVLCLSLCSCGIADLFRDGGTTTGASHTIVGADTEKDNPSDAPKPMDFTQITASEYITVNYKGLELVTDYQKREITDELVSDEFRDLLIYYEYYQLITSGTAAAGSTIEISYKGIMDGKEFSGGSSDKATILLDDEKSGYIPGFAAGLIGHNVGETVDLILKFPDDYYSDLAGKPVTFRVTIKGICEATQTDSSANSLSSGKYSTVAAYKAYMKEYLIAQETMQEFRNVYSQIIEKLSENSEVKSYPDQQVQYYYQDMVRFISEQAKSSNQSYDSLLKSMGYTDEMLRKDAENETKKDLAIVYVAQAENIVVTDEVYREYLNEMVESYNSQGYNYSVEIIENYYDTYYGEGYLRNQAQEEKVVDKVYQLAHVTYDPNYGKEATSSAIQ